MTAPLLSVRDLSVEFLTRRGAVTAVAGVSFDIACGETLAIVGESGSGKSATSLAVMGLIDLPGRVKGGDVVFDGRSLASLSRAAREDLRGRELAMVFQDPMSTLNPLLTIGTQIGEVIDRHFGLPRRARDERVCELLSQVGMPRPRERLALLPHEFSGGQRQRILIAMALAGEPKLLIADEPTTALDVTLQAQILDLIANLRDRLGLSLLLVTHDLGVVASIADRVAVMYAGRIVEVGPVDALFAAPAHPYTAGLLRATPRLDALQRRMTAIDGAPPDPRHLPAGCAFAPRCPLADDACRAAVPPIVSVNAGCAVRCLKPFVPAWQAVT